VQIGSVCERGCARSSAATATAFIRRDDSLSDLFFPVLIPFVAFFLALLFGGFLRRYDCPDCGTPLPRFISPQTKTKRQWLEGGWICPTCGIEVDASGRKAEMPCVTNWVKLSAWFSALAALGGLAIILLGCIVSHKSSPTLITPAPPRQPHPALITPAQPAAPRILQPLGMQQSQAFESHTFGSTMKAELSLAMLAPWTILWHDVP
jgi:hypothetical protein